MFLRSFKRDCKVREFFRNCKLFRDFFVDLRCYGRAAFIRDDWRPYAGDRLSEPARSWNLRG